MNTLFVCRGNTGRSQVAMEFYNKISKGKAESAGTVVDNPGQLLKDREGARTVIQAMLEEGIDMSKNERTQLTETMLKKYDRVIVMAEPENIPAWLRDNSKTDIWTVPDIKGQPIEDARRIVKQIKHKVLKLVET